MSTVLEDWCFDCGNEGPSEEDKVCPGCKREYAGLGLEHKPEEFLTGFIEKSNKLGIPSHYVGNEWSRDMFAATYGIPQEARENETHPLMVYLQKLHNIHEVFKRGELPPASAMILADVGTSKATWVHSCMSHALANGYTVAPYFDTVEVNRVLNVNAQINKIHTYKGLTAEDYISRDVLFMCVTKGQHRKDAWSIIMDVLSKRSRKGLGSIITSSFGFHTLHMNDNTGTFHRLSKVGGKEDPMKFPQLISYFDTEVR
jgi:hypothetical protein